MTIFVDELKVWGSWRYGASCHMQPGCKDAYDLEALHKLAAAIGLRQSWFQRGTAGRYPHYDLTASRRAAALKAGAVETDTRTVLKAWRVGAGLFKDEPSGLLMRTDLYYLLSDSGSAFSPLGFESVELAKQHAATLVESYGALEPEVPTFVPEETGWDGVDYCNVMFGKDLLEFQRMLEKEPTL